MIVYRLSKSKYKNDLSGGGAKKAGGRWNSIGAAVLYTSQSRALCALEVAVHIPLGLIPEDYHLLSIQIPDKLAGFKKIDPDILPYNWKNHPPSASTQKFGNQFVAENKYLILKVPSAVVQGDFNYLLNPAHPNFGEIEIVSDELFEFDKRLF